MTASSWKALSLPGLILLIALGLQAGAIKIMTGLNPPTPSAQTDSRPTPAPHTGAESTHTPANITADPPPSTTPAMPSTPTSGMPNPEAGLDTHGATPPATPPNPEAAPAAHSTANPEAATLPAYHPMTSNIPPPIELDPEPSEAKPAAEAPKASPEAAVATPNPSPLVESATPTDTTLLEPDWLKGRDAKRYTVQLYSGKDMAKLREIAGSVTGTAPSSYFVTTSRSGPWYSLVIGDYPDFTTAQAAATQIATQVSTIKPWIRRFSEIQAKMR